MSEEGSDIWMEEPMPAQNIWTATLSQRQEISSLKDQLDEIARVKRGLEASADDVDIREVLASLDSAARNKRAMISRLKPAADSIKILTGKLAKTIEKERAVSDKIEELLVERVALKERREALEAQLAPLKQAARQATPQRSSAVEEYDLCTDDGYLSPTTPAVPPAPPAPAPASEWRQAKGPKQGSKQSMVSDLRARFEKAGETTPSARGRENSRTPPERVSRNRFAPLAVSPSPSERDRQAEELLRQAKAEAEVSRPSVPEAPSAYGAAASSAGPRVRPYSPREHARRQSRQFEADFASWQHEQRVRMRLRGKSAPPQNAPGPEHE